MDSSLTASASTSTSTTSKASWSTLLSSGEVWQVGSTEIPSDKFKTILDKNGMLYQTQVFKGEKGSDRVNFTISAKANGGSMTFWSQVHDMDKQYDPRLG